MENSPAIGSFAFSGDCSAKNYEFLKSVLLDSTEFFKKDILESFLKELENINGTVGSWEEAGVPLLVIAELFIFFLYFFEANLIFDSKRNSGS